MKENEEHTMKLKLITALTACAMLVTAFSGCAPKSQKYSIDGPIVQQEIQYEVMIDTELAVEFLKGSSSMYLNEGHGEGAYIAHNPFHTLELDKSRVLTGMAYFPIINDGKIIDAIVALPADETVFCMNTSGSTDWELINEKLSANPDAQWLFCTIGTVPGMPGDLTTSSALRISSSVWRPSSKAVMVKVPVMPPM